MFIQELTEEQINDQVDRIVKDYEADQPRKVFLKSIFQKHEPRYKIETRLMPNHIVNKIHWHIPRRWYETHQDEPNLVANEIQWDRSPRGML